VTDRARSTLPWSLVAGSALLALLFAYVLFLGYLPARHRALQLEGELRALYTREADLQKRLDQQEQRQSAQERQVITLTAERDALARRLEEIERQAPPPAPRR
jgi:septal ring factor EnvC (AmiA/AmiB activator)